MDLHPTMVTGVNSIINNNVKVGALALKLDLGETYFMTL